MSISDNRLKKQSARKTAAVYLGVSLFCGLFSTIYEHYSHGVYSDYMVYLFLFPLLGGALPFAAIGFIEKLRYPGRLSLNLYHSGVAALTVGSCFKGVVEIYGTTSALVPVYWIAGAAFAAAGAFVYLLSVVR
ncbi:MAG: hypothetical protein AB7D36_02125 [Oscillospiraceae bacterium]